MLTGKAKTDYMREYMRRRRSNARTNKGSNPDTVRPNTYGKQIENAVRINQMRREGMSDDAVRELIYERDDYSQ